MSHIQLINSLLQNELSAVAAYQQALNKFRKQTALGEMDFLMSSFEDHKAAVFSLQGKIKRLGGTAVQDSGAWGTWAKITMAGANLLGKQTALKALREGELTGFEEYEKALQDHELPAEARSLIETKLLPAQQRHMRTLDSLLDAVMA
ncbi:MULTISPECIES: DUF2383 domain-containing protein [Methylomonas]|uniref:DUF2383 domain-containing protein n=2 Tax=Methylomonas TaxID=416 RepID=A0A126T8Y6_9GAMM|nr:MULTISPECIES: DUF2383 domain-containing protein [Methylomonas]AMK78553.1 hypothetical protein JT25_019000 [Methylomonas denitrificans]OAI06463.1 hypothetical protein A1342_06520 [Methylomonas methanica]TCV77387.1 uncharacterized protein DUF2383 [Methylomonas methanica]